MFEVTCHSRVRQLVQPSMRPPLRDAGKLGRDFWRVCHLWLSRVPWHPRPLHPLIVAADAAGCTVHAASHFWFFCRSLWRKYPFRLSPAGCGDQVQGQSSLRNPFVEVKHGGWAGLVLCLPDVHVSCPLTEVQVCVSRGVCVWAHVCGVYVWGGEGWREYCLEIIHQKRIKKYHHLTKSVTTVNRKSVKWCKDRYFLNNSFIINNAIQSKQIKTSEKRYKGDNSIAAKCDDLVFPI